MRESAEIERLRSALRKAGVAGVEDFSRFVNDTGHFRPSDFDVRAAVPVLAEVLPSLADPQVVETVAAYLAGPWSRSALPALIGAFRHWALEFPLGAGWQLGNAIGAAADDACAAGLLELAVDPQFGKARQMIVYVLWRFRQRPEIRAELVSLSRDPDVAIHAMSALRRAVGNAEALPILLQIAATHADPRVRENAARAANKAEKAIATSSTN